MDRFVKLKKQNYKTATSADHKILHICFTILYTVMKLKQFYRPGPVFLSLARSKLRLWSANHRPGYWSNRPCDWPSTAWAYSGPGDVIQDGWRDLVRDCGTTIAHAMLLAKPVPVAFWTLSYLGDRPFCRQCIWRALPRAIYKNHLVEAVI